METGRDFAVIWVKDLRILNQENVGMKRSLKIQKIGGQMDRIWWLIGSMETGRVKCQRQLQFLTKMSE